VDQILYGQEATGKSTERMQFGILLDELTDAEIKILTATAQALLDARADNETEAFDTLRFPMPVCPASTFPAVLDTEHPALAAPVRSNRGRRL